MKAYLEPEEVALMEESADNLRDRLLVRVLFRLGCRISEALPIAVEEIDFLSRTVTIQHLKARMKLSCHSCSARLGRSHAYCPKCGAEVEGAVAEERQHRRVRTLPIDPDTLEMLKECAEKAGLPKLVNPETGRIHNVSPHRMRDAFAVNAVKHDDSGDGLRMLQQHLGHQSFNTTARYRKISGEEHNQWYQKLWRKE